ncbi:DNA polymerase III subunit beta [Candidatus Shapirobacteria bacterium RIFOXYD1_FULL_38_32]|uniref:Beta sliding clamp n=2 Tax=Candidatus Shapironibacteriota TaxID=1752721 RepID=A0A0G0K4M5_9BACT|nr:MAG: polymerase III subunit beta protein [Candidatus Shapirobacteria bacterium GW2011_GWE2_38_30]OGL55814.1 MAG: DNA polymerase III subunit beta [Candidatus Shapirobacteria bacterium RIFOXYA1_FULL_39_17]OGL56708.1 MAG: DNA polymerase III subunit beta [Candidatus Shapirobacteria bacterium RIFOXYB1_FULL_38_38]OGL57044.1 MAG: DNA polymerase III subunit beta [Candidatus Shapirobacteria bacterium RIFOXYC1_FULL_38_24]OGL58296.1 MAG: DNA polymerase III subunit beta [Candidatus Shapirobacteria bacte
MKFSVLQENLNTALQNVSRFVSPKTQLPILSNILFQSDQGRLKLSATNLELGINYWLGAKLEDEGSFTIPSKEITEFVSYLSAGKIDVDLNDKSLLTVNSAKASSTFTTSPATDFPTSPSLDLSKAFDLDLSLLTKTVNQIVFASASDDTRPILTSVYWHFTPDQFTIAATDGFRLSVKTSKLVNPLNIQTDPDGFTFLVPARTLAEVVKLAKTSKTVKLGPSPDEHQLVFVLEDLELVSRLVQGDFPPFQKIIPKETATKVYLDRAELTQAIKIVSVFARESANVVKFSLKTNSIELSANAPQLGQNKVDVDARIEGAPLDIAFNFKFVSDFLNICTGDEVLIELNEPLSSAIFRDQADPEFTHIIMPVRIQD